jgi:hypothetical protein
MPDTSFVDIGIRKVWVLGVDDLTGAQDELTMQNLTKYLRFCRVERRKGSQEERLTRYKKTWKECLT